MIVSVKEVLQRNLLSIITKRRLQGVHSQGNLNVGQMPLHVQLRDIRDIRREQLFFLILELNIPRNVGVTGNIFNRTITLSLNLRYPTALQSKHEQRRRKIIQ